MVSTVSGCNLNQIHAIDAYEHQTCTENLREGLKLADSLFSEGKWRVVGGGGWAGPKNYYLLVSF